MMTDKRALRARMRAERDRFAASCDAVILPPEPLLQRLRDGCVVASYIPLGSEADPSLIAAAAREHGCRLALPFVTNRIAPIRFLQWDEDTPLVEGPHGLLQPPEDAPEVEPAIILTPLVAFDQALNRLGQGAGHYDRAFARFPDAWRLGVAWSAQQVPAIPTDMWDIRLHAIVTERDYLEHREPQ